MQKSCECEVATHIGPESCGAARKGGVEALTGERAGRVFSRVRQLLRDADAVRRSGRPHRVRRYREACQSPARSETPCTYTGRLLWDRMRRLITRWLPVPTVCHPYPLRRMGVITLGKSRMREFRLSGSVEGVRSNHDPYSDYFHMHPHVSTRTGFL
jgi:hypothetical protein